MADIEHEKGDTSPFDPLDQRGKNDVLRVEGISLAFGGLQVLENVSFAARAGELLALIGPNGAGKTSVLNCICGIYRPGPGGSSSPATTSRVRGRTGSRRSAWRGHSSTGSSSRT